VAATTLDAVAREAGVGRATLYRHFPKGRQQLFDELVIHEVERFFIDLYGAVEHLTTISDVLVRGLLHAHDAVSRHVLLQRILREDPNILEPGLTVAVQSIESQIAEVFRPYLPDGTHVDEHADFLARMSLDYVSTQGRWDLTNEAQVRELVEDELLSWTMASPRAVAPATVRPLRTVHDDSTRGRVIDATLNEVAGGRYSALTIDRLVQVSGVSRATIYRSFPGGRPGIIGAARDREGARLFAAAADAMVREDTLDGALLAGLTTMWRHVSDHAAIAGFCASDPEIVRRSLRFEEASRTYFVASSFAQPLLVRWVDPDTSGRLAEWLCRVAVAYFMFPAEYLDTQSPTSIASFYARHLSPGVSALAAHSR
jgi:AcrR family transcriptional regulator